MFTPTKPKAVDLLVLCRPVSFVNNKRLFYALFSHEIVLMNSHFAYFANALTMAVNNGVAYTSLAQCGGGSAPSTVSDLIKVFVAICLRRQICTFSHGTAKPENRHFELASCLLIAIGIKGGAIKEVVLRQVEPWEAFSG